MARDSACAVGNFDVDIFGVANSLTRDAMVMLIVIVIILT